MKIYHLTLNCFNLESMKKFYTEILEMELLYDRDTSFVVKVGSTKLTFVKNEQHAFYHVCFRSSGIYFDHVFSKLALQDLLLSNEQGENKMYWEGKQAYFYDPDGNILEILERPIQKNPPEPFGWYDVGEVGLPSRCVQNLKKELNAIEDVVEDHSNAFAFFGDQHGFFVLVNEGRHWYPTNKEATIHPITVCVSGEINKTILPENLPYKIVVKKEWDTLLPVVQVRIARPTNQLDKMIEFYEKGLLLERIGEFFNHNGYDGIMLGMPRVNYHLEFTQHEEAQPIPQPSGDNLLVFYIPSISERNKAVDRLIRLGYNIVSSENPYWDIEGVTIEDPDQWRVVLVCSSGI